jgi:Multicopper oxidase
VLKQFALAAFHLHGNNFWLIQNNNSDVINTVNPIIRDVRLSQLTAVKV